MASPFTQMTRVQSPLQVLTAKPGGQPSGLAGHSQLRLGARAECLWLQKLQPAPMLDSPWLCPGMGPTISSSISLISILWRTMGEGQ